MILAMSALGTETTVPVFLKLICVVPNTAIVESLHENDRCERTWSIYILIKDVAFVTSSEEEATEKQQY